MRQRTATLGNLLEDFAADGYEDADGGFGTVTFHLETLTIRVECSWHETVSHPDGPREGEATAHPLDHAKDSARKFGGVSGGYLPIHQWFDESKAIMADVRHRALRHHSEGIFLGRADLRRRHSEQRREGFARVLNRR